MPITSLTPIGISIPIKLGNNGYFQQTFDTVSQSRASLINLLNTRIGERPMNPTFGSRIYNELFEQDIDNNLIQVIIEEEVEQWIPSITVKSVNISTTIQDIDNYIINITVNYVVNNTEDSVTLTISP